MRILPVILALLLPIASFTPAALAICRGIDDAFPPTTAGQCARDFLGVLNNPRPDAVRTFELRWASAERLKKTPIEARTASLAKIHDDLGTVTVSRVDAATPLTVFAAAASGEALAFQFTMSIAESDKLDSITIAPASEVTGMPLSAELLASTVHGVAERLRNGYVFPELGAKMAESILANLKAGRYNGITGEGALALRLTEDCRAISNDKHLGIRPAPPSDAGAGPADNRVKGRDPRSENFGFKRVEILPGNIGYLRFDIFFESEEAYDVASSAMNFLAGADAIVFDLRHNGGGSPDMIRHITSYLFDSRTHLNDMVDRSGGVVEEFWTKEDVKGRRPRAGVPVFVLTSGRTFSGAEEFSYNLQNLKRAVIVGETTGGGAHPVRMERINERFSIRVPYMRARNPVTGTNWEGKGVEPDVKCMADTALDKAVELAREAISRR